MTRSLLPLLICFAVVVASPTYLFAQPSGSELELYEDYLRRGSKAFENEDFEAALFLFAKAQEIHDHPRLRFSMARIYEELEQCVAAKMLYTLLMENDAAPEELRRDAGMRLANSEQCGEPTAVTPAAPAEPGSPPIALLPVDIDEPVRSAAASRNLRNFGLWSIGVGAGLTTAGVVFVFGTFVPKVHRDCFGLRGVSVDEQVAACESIAGDDGDFLSAHVQSRQVVQQHRVASTALLAAGIAGSALGLTLLHFDRTRRTAVIATPRGVAITRRF